MVQIITLVLVFAIFVIFLVDRSSNNSSQKIVVNEPTQQAPTQARQALPSWSDWVLSPDQIDLVLSDAYTQWAENPRIVWIEYSDLECPFCKRLHESETVTKILEKYSNDIGYSYKHFPLAFHANAQKEAEAAECAWELGDAEKYFSYINTIFARTSSNGKGFSLDALTPLAKELGINETKFKACLDSGKYIQKTQGDLSEGQQLFGVNGTPGNVLLDMKTWSWKLLAGALPFASFDTAISQMLSQ